MILGVKLQYNNSTKRVNADSSTLNIAGLRDLVKTLFNVQEEVAIYYKGTYIFRDYI